MAKVRIDAHYYKGKKKTIFTSVRFGNVIGSRGSVIPFFKEQIQRGGPITITNPEMRRFMMSIGQAINLVFKATQMTQGGDIFIFKMPVLKMSDLVEVMINELAPCYGYKPEKIKMKVIGARPGEKLYENLMTEEESVNAQETKEMFIVLPQIEIYSYRKKRYIYQGAKPAGRMDYTSRNQGLIKKNQIKKLLYEANIVTKI